MQLSKGRSNFFALVNKKLYKQLILSVNQDELAAIIFLLQHISSALNIATNYQYYVFVVQHIYIALISPSSLPVDQLFISLQQILYEREHHLYITHIRAHIDLPGPLSEGNHATDQMIATLYSDVFEFHNYSYANCRALKAWFSLTTQEANAIISQYNI